MGAGKGGHYEVEVLSVAVAAALSAPALAVQPVTITSTGIYNPGNVTATIGGTIKNEFSVPLTFTALGKGKGEIDVLGFCVDLPHNISVGVGSQLRQTLAYHVAPLTSDGYGNPLSDGQVRQIIGLARLGFTIAKGGAADKPAQLAAIQQAIWTIEYPHASFVASGPYAAAQAGYASDFIVRAPKLGGFARNIIADNGAVQGQVTNVGGVPEPTVWLEMLAGFGVIGALSRRRARQPAIVTA